MLQPFSAFIFAVLLHSAFQNSVGDVFIRTRTSGSLFNLARLKAKTKTIEVLLRELLFADDAAVVAHNESVLQLMLDNLERACTLFSLSMNINKTVVMRQATGTSLDPVNITLNGDPLEVVDRFNYLGSTFTSSLSLDEEVNIRIGKAATTFGGLSKRVWRNQKLTLRTKFMIYQACVLSTLLYGAETWTSYASQEKRLNSFHMRCLRKILNVTWQDKITNSDILQRAGLTSIHGLLRSKRLKWLGHLRRMTNDRIPKLVLYGELCAGKRKQCKPKV